MDNLKILLVVGILAMVFTLLSLGSVVWANAGSRNLTLAAAALTSAILFFVIQLAFELRGSEDTDFISVELTIDRAKPEIRQWKYPTHTNWRIHAEIEASDWLKTHMPDLFNTDREKVHNNLVIFSLVSYLASTQYDWQLKSTKFKGSTTGTLTTYQKQSKPHECAIFSQEILDAHLIQAGNAYAGAPLKLVAGPICFPPKTTLVISATDLVLKNPFGSISFTLEPSGSISYMKPGTGGEVPQLPDEGGAQFETRITGFRIKSEEYGIRAHHKKADLYRSWRTRLINGAQTWFEG
jgi:hypothetical protein